MTAITAPRTVSPRQIARFEYLLLGDLREVLSLPPGPHTRPELVALLTRLFELLPQQFAMKEQGGYLSEVTERFPNWQDQVDALRIEHAFLYEDLRSLRNDVDDPMRFRAAKESTMARIAEWMDRFRNHELEERRLAQLGMNLEIGGAG